MCKHIYLFEVTIVRTHKYCQMTQHFAKEDFTNLGYLITTFTDEQLLPIKEEIYHILKNPQTSARANGGLVGQIEKEYLLIDTKKYLEDLVGPFCYEYNQIYGYTDTINILSTDVPIRLETAWVNFQKKHEYNPVHNHSGLYSFVIWIEIPYKIEDELANFPAKDAAMKCPGHFEFVYSNSIGQHRKSMIPADCTYENKMIFFPAPMMHSVNPFYTSDKYRISISGNFLLDVSL